MNISLFARLCNCTIMHSVQMTVQSDLQKSVQYFFCFLRSIFCIFKFHFSLVYDLFSHIPPVFHCEGSWRNLQERGTCSVCTMMCRGTRTTKHLVILYRQGNHGGKFASSRMLVLNKLEGRNHSQAFF